MKTTALYLVFSIFCVSLVSALPIISPTLLNGSFEEGTLSPWIGGSATENSTFALQGDWFAETEATVNRSSLFIFFNAVSNDSLDFTLSFYARASAEGFTEVSASLSGRKENNSFLYADTTLASGNILSNSEWVEYQYEFSFNEEWDTNKSMGLSIDFSEGNSGAIGYLDLVSLTQIPEPSRYSLLASLLVFTTALKRRVRSSPTRQ